MVHQSEPRTDGEPLVSLFSKVNPSQWRFEGATGIAEAKAAIVPGGWLLHLPADSGEALLVDNGRGCTIASIRSLVKRLGPLGEGFNEVRGWVRKESKKGKVGPEVWLAGATEASSLSNRAKARVLRAAAVAATRGRRIATAKCLLAHARSIEWETGDLTGFLRNEVCRVQIDRAESRLGEGLRRASAVVEISELIEDRELASGSAGHMAALAIELGEWDMASRALEQMMAISGLGNASANAAYAASMLTWYELSLSQTADRDPDLIVALNRSRDSVGYYRGKGDIPNLGSELANRAWVELELGLVSSARSTLKELRGLNLPSGQFSNATAGILEGRIAIREGRPKLAQEIFERTYESTKALSGQSASETTWPALWGVASSLRAQGRGEKSVALYLQALEEMLSLAARTDGALASFLGGRRRFLDELMDGLLEAGRTAEAFEVAAILQWLVLRGEQLDRAASIAPGVDSADWPDRPEGCLALEEQRESPVEESPLSTLRRQYRSLVLGPDEAFVTVVRGLKKSRAFILRGDGELLLKAFTERAPLAWESAVKDVRHLYIASQVGGDKGVLALAGGAELLKNHTLTLVPHLGVLLRRPLSAPGNTRTALFGSGANFPTEREERELFKSRSFLLKDGAEVRDLASLGPADVLFFSGHGALDSGSLWGSKLFLSPDRAVPLVEWLEARVPFRLVILSACSTASATRFPSGHWFGFAEGMLVAGADTVLAARGEVSSTAAHRFVSRFLEEGGVDKPAEAYRNTVLGLRKVGDPAWDDFLLFGRRGRSR